MLHQPEKKSPWNPYLVDLLREKWKEGKSAKQISHILTTKAGIAITRNAVIGKVHRLRLPSRPSPIIRNGLSSYA